MRSNTALKVYPTVGRAKGIAARPGSSRLELGRRAVQLDKAHPGVPERQHLEAGRVVALHRGMSEGGVHAHDCSIEESRSRDDLGGKWAIKPHAELGVGRGSTSGSTVGTWLEVACRRGYLRGGPGIERAPGRGPFGGV